MLHIDLYGYEGTIPGRWQDEPKRVFEGQEAVDYAERWVERGFPYFNGYTLLTPLHDDGDCDQHRPTGPVWSHAIQGQMPTLRWPGS